MLICLVFYCLVIQVDQILRISWALSKCQMWTLYVIAGITLWAEDQIRKQKVVVSSSDKYWFWHPRNTGRITDPNILSVIGYWACTVLRTHIMFDKSCGVTARNSRIYHCRNSITFLLHALGISITFHMEYENRTVQSLILSFWYCRMVVKQTASHVVSTEIMSARFDLCYSQTERTAFNIP